MGAQESTGGKGELALVDLPDKPEGLPDCVRGAGRVRGKPEVLGELAPPQGLNFQDLENVEVDA